MPASVTRVLLRYNVLELHKSPQMLQTDIGDLRVEEVQRLELGQFPQMFRAGIGDLRAA